jgi:hypothetical protein
VKKVLKELEGRIEKIEKEWNEYITKVREEEYPAQIFDGHAGSSISPDGAIIE